MIPVPPFRGVSLRALICLNFVFVLDVVFVCFEEEQFGLDPNRKSISLHFRLIRIGLSKVR